MKSCTFSLMAALALPAMLVANAGQDPKSNEQPPQTSAAGATLSPAALQVVERFEKVAPKVGDELPDLTVHDADGKEFKLRSLKGRYTVLVSGCVN